MNSNKKNIVLFFLAVVLSYLVSGWAGQLYESIVGRKVSGIWLISCPACWTGFVLAFVFLVTLLFSGLSDGKKRLYYSLYLGLPLPILALLARDGDVFLLSLGAGIIGLGLGQVVYLIRKR